MRRLLLALAIVAAGPALAASPAPANPLQPLDRSSPRATLHTFLSSAEALASQLAGRYEIAQTRAGHEALLAHGREVVRCLDLEKLAPAARLKGGRAAALALFETLTRIPLPPPDEIPDAARLATLQGRDATRWTIPGTEISLVRVDEGASGVEWLFSPETVARAEEFYERTRDLPRLRPVAVPDLHAMVAMGGGWLIPLSWIRALPAWARAPLDGQAVWKWIALLVLVLGAGGFVVLAFRLSRLGEKSSPFRRALGRFALPLSVLVATPVFTWLALMQVNLVGAVGSFLQSAATAVVFCSAAWVSWRAAPVVAEALLSSPRIARESVDAHLIRLTVRLLGIVGSLSLLAVGADRLGIPVYGIVAGLGVGGLAVALSAQPTLENLIAGLNLFADRPLRVGDRCKFGDTSGTVESIGIRSARIRTGDRTVTTIPNGMLAKMPIVNYSRRDRSVFETRIGLPRGTPPDRVRGALAELNALVEGNARVVKGGTYARLVAIGATSLDVEVRATVDTTDGAAFQAVQEELLLGVLEVSARFS